MVHDADRMPVLNPYEKCLPETDRKLRDALDRLVKGTPRDGSLQERRYQLSVASLAREAGVARNAIYTNHRAMIEVLKTEQRRLVTENAALLKRAIEAAAARHQRQNDRLLKERDSAQRPVALVPRSRTE